MKPQPLTKQEVLEQQAASFVGSVSHLDAKHTFEFRRLVREAAELAQDDVVTANLIEAGLHGVVGNDALADRLLANATANNGGARVENTRLAILANRMNFSRAHEVGKDLLLNRGGSVQFHRVAHSMLAVGGFRAVRDAIVASQAKGEVLHLTEKVNLARAAADVLERLGIDDAHCAKVLDAMGEVARRADLVWLHDLPEVSVLDNVDGEDAVMMSYRFAVEAGTATALAWEFVDLLVDRELDRPGFYVEMLAESVAVPVMQDA